MQSIAAFHGLSELYGKPLLQSAIETEVRALGHSLLNLDSQGLKQLQTLDPRRERVAFTVTCSEDLEKSYEFVRAAKMVARSAPSISCRPQDVIALLRELRASLSLWQSDQLSIEVRSAMLTIYEKLSDPDLSIQSIAKSVGCSHDFLQSSFREELNCSVWSYVKHVRLERAKELLTTTSLQVGDVAWSVGSESHTNFSREFRLATGISPILYRAKTVDRSASKQTPSQLEARDLTFCLT